MPNKIFIYLLYFGLFAFYIVTPLILSKLDYQAPQIELTHGYNKEISYILDNIELIFSQFFFLVIIFLFYFITFFLLSKITRYIDAHTERNVNYEVNKVIMLLVLPCSILLIFDLIEIFNFIKETNFTINEYRNEIYYKFLDKKKTYINILIVLTPIIFNEYRKISLFIYLQIIIYCLLSFSRFELILLFLVHANLNFKINYKILFFLMIILFIIVNLRTLIFYDINFSFYYFQTIFKQNIGEPIHVFLSNMTAIQYIKDITFYEYISHNMKFLCNNLFYTNYEVINISKQSIIFFQNNKNYIRMFSVSGFSSILMFFPIFVIQLIVMYFLSKKIENKQILKAYTFFLLLFLFRGNFVHIGLFLVKLSLLIILLLWIIKKMRLLNFKAE